MLIPGACHCGNLSFVVDWQPDPTQIPARGCTCSFCVKHGAVWTSSGAATLNVTVRRPSLVSRYAFGTRTAEFHVCATCGAVPVATCRIDDRLYAVVNVNAFDHLDPALLHRTSSAVGEEDRNTRLARRKRNWFGTVDYVELDG
jgi:hypothetical protein